MARGKDVAIVVDEVEKRELMALARRQAPPGDRGTCFQSATIVSDS